MSWPTRLLAPLRRKVLAPLVLAVASVGAPAFGADSADPTALRATATDVAIPVLGKPQTVFTLAQEALWLTPTKFAIGRWDGTITVFATSEGAPPKLVAAFSTPSATGIEAMHRLGDESLLVSDGWGAIAVINLKTGDARSFNFSSPENGELGTVNTFARVIVNGEPRIVAGHTMGFLSVWKRESDTWTVERIVDVRSPNPIASPYPLKNVRGLATAGGSVVVTGSEDGDLAAVDVSTGKVLARQRYEASALRGINGIALDGDKLLVTSCPSSAELPNLHLFKWDGTSFMLLDRATVHAKGAVPPVFTFDLAVVRGGGFFATTEDGMLWPGSIAADRIVLGTGVAIDERPSGPGTVQIVLGAAAIAVADDGKQLVAVSALAKVFPLAQPAQPSPAKTAAVAAE